MEFVKLENIEPVTKVCTRCGEEKDIREFRMTHGVRSGVCEACRAKAISESLNGKKKTNPLEKFSTSELRDELNRRGVKLIAEPTPREMMERLAKLGYKGKLTITRTETIDIENF